MLASEVTVQFPNTHLQLSAGAGDPAFCPTSAVGSASDWGNLSVALLPGINAFFASLSPRYKSQPHSATAAPPATPPDWDTVSSQAGNLVSKVKLASNVLGCWVPSVRVVTEAVATVCSTLSLAEELDEVLEQKRPPQTPSLTGPVATGLTLVIMDNIPSAGAVPPSGMPGSVQNPIPVSDSATLSMIGQKGYPKDGYYIQERSFRHDISKPSPAFAGHYDGGSHSISGLKTCLFSDIERHGVVRNLRLVDVDIDYHHPMQGALACTMEPYSTARGIQVAHANVRSQGGGKDGDLAGVGVIVGHQKEDALISGVDLRNCTVVTYSTFSATGVLGGRIDGRVQDANISNCRAESRNVNSPTGTGAGQLRGDIERLAIEGSQVISRQQNSPAGIGAGQMERGSIRQFSAGRCEVLAEGQSPVAGVGAGMAVGELQQLTVVKCRVKAREKAAIAGIGAGQLGSQSAGEDSHLDNLIAVDSSVETQGDASAGIGIGRLNTYSRADRMTLINCSVTGQAGRAYTGIGAGYSSGQINNLTSVASEARNSAGTAGLVSGNNGTAQGTASLNSRINDKLRTSNPPDLPGLCSDADPRFVTPDCSPALYTDARPALLSTPLAPARGSVWLPIEVNNEATLNSIGHNASFPSDAVYIQTRDLDGSRLDSNSSLVFSGHYDGQNHMIRNQHECLFGHLRGTLKNLHLTGARINTSGQNTAVAACTMSGGSLIKNLWITDSQVSNQEAPAGIVSGQRIGRHNQVMNIVVDNATVENQGAAAGVIAGQCEGVTKVVDIHNSRVKTRGNRASAGLGCGWLSGELDTFDATCSQVETLGRGSSAGIGAGIVIRGKLNRMTIIDSTVRTSGKAADAGGGAGILDGELNYFNALHTKIHTKGNQTSAGTGVGQLYHVSKMKHISSANCETVTEGSQTHAGVCAGTTDNGSDLSFTKSVNNTVRVNDQSSFATVHGQLPDGTEAVAKQSITVNTRVNHTLVDDGPVPHNVRKNFCEFANPRLVLADCRINQLNLAESCARPFLYPAPNALPTTKVPTRLEETVTLPPVSLLPVTTVVPLATGLSISTMVGIAAVGTVGVIAAGAVAAYCYHRYHRSPKPEDDAMMEML